ncbi:MAG: UDP-N-acetylglucosamine 2-epimerase (hydrolyzing) [Spirochaetales bacterium]|nr:UDP-N-acetylglucosamine 2-epimerase (hydrolyzing) [Spirochaetales bacterium]
MKKVCVVITARPSYSRIRSALFALKKYDDIELQIVVAASAILDAYGKVVKQIIKDGFSVAASVHNMISGEDVISSAKTTGMGIIELATVFDNIKPDYVVTIADRYETMSTAIAASYMNIPLIHIQGGEVTGNIDEKVRHAITKLADVHLVSTPLARERVIKMGERPDRIYVTGCPSIDIAENVRNNYNSLVFDPIEKYNGVGNLFPERSKYIVVMQHPVTTSINEAREQTRCVLDVVESIDRQIYWFWPNVDAGSDSVSKEIRIHRENGKAKNIYFFKNMSPDDFLVLLMGSDCIIGNSSVAIRECSYLGVPAINIGDRQIGRERGHNVIDCDYNPEEILNAYHTIVSSPRCERDELYGDGHAGEKIAEVIHNLGNIAINKILAY